MAKKDTTTTALAERQTSALAIADGAAGGSRGRENIDQRDVTFPRLAIAQKTSPQLEESKAEYVADLKMYDLFNSLTGELYGRGPVTVAVVGYSKKAMQFDADNNVIDPSVPLDDPRCQFQGDQKPEATTFHEFLAINAETFEPFVLSLKGTQIKTAKKLLGIIQVRGGDIWGGLYSITSGPKPAGAFTVGAYNIVPAGKTPLELVAMCERLYEQTKGKTIQTDRDARPEGDAADSGDAPF